MHGVVNLWNCHGLSLEQLDGIQLFTGSLFAAFNKRVDGSMCEAAAGESSHGHGDDQVTVLLIILRPAGDIAARRAFHHIHERTVLPVRAYAKVKFDANHDVGAKLSCHIGGKIVFRTAIHEHHVAHVDRGEHAWYRHARAYASHQRAARQHHCAVGDQVGSYANELTRQVAHEVYAVGIALQIVGKRAFDIVAADYATGFRVDAAAHVKFALIDIGVACFSLIESEMTGIATVQKQVGPIHRAEHRREVVAVVAHAVHRSNNAADARAHHHIDGYSCLLNHLQRTHMACAQGTAAAKHECNFLAIVYTVNGDWPRHQWKKHDYRQKRD